MSTFTNYWKIITPASRKNSYQNVQTITMDDGVNVNAAGYSVFSNMDWYTNVLKGSTARMQRYRQYDSMDYGDISRALDVIAEEMSNFDKNSNLPFLIDYQIEDNQSITDNTSTTIRAALRHWSNFHGLNKRMYHISRCLIKYGDCFFRKISDTKKWEYIDPTRVVGIGFNVEGERTSYHIRPSAFQNDLKNKIGPAGNQNNLDTIEISPADAIIHFTLSDDMGESAPFGISILQNAFKDFQKLVMLEDASIIYRIVRAPERRVYTLFTGNLPPNRVQGFLEGFRNSLRQKRQPNTANQMNVDSGYNPESISDDIILSTTGQGKDSTVTTLPSGTNWEIPELDYFQNKVFRALRVPSSYMKGQDAANPGALFNNGKTGVAYMEERIFANFVTRLQVCVQTPMDDQFKAYLRATGINVDSDIFMLKLAEPDNFEKYIKTSLFTEQITAYKSISDEPSLSKEFMLGRFLGLTKDELATNASMLEKERGLKPSEIMPIERLIYDPIIEAARKPPEEGAEEGLEAEENSEKPEKPEAEPPKE
jgi:hypothetical protein